MPAHQKSRAAKELRGTDRPRRRIPADRAGRLLIAPGAPRGLSKRARAEWKALAPAAVALGSLSATDLRGFRLLCETLATAGEAAEIVAVDGFTIETTGGGKKAHPAVRILETARTQARAMLAEFGLTPRGRQSVDTAPISASASPAAPDPAGEGGFARVRALRGES